MQHVGLFEGIGGFSLAARWMGWNTVAWCEWNEFGQKVLRHHFPEAEGFGDITKTDFTKYANTINILTGGFPCQPYSLAGKRKGKADERHLWPEMLRAVREIQPSYVVGENVLGLLNWNGGMVFDEVQANLETEGYEVFPYVLPACAVNAPHRRDRIWFVAYSSSNGHKLRGFRKDRSAESESEGSGDQRERIWHDGGRIGEQGIITDTTGEGRKEWEQNNIGTHSEENSAGVEYESERLGNTKVIADPSDPGLQRREFNRTSKQDIGGEQPSGSITEFHKVSNWEQFPTQPPICGRNDGISSKLDGITFSKHRNESIKGYGNAIVPQVAYQIFKAIQEYAKTH